MCFTTVFFFPQTFVDISTNGQIFPRSFVEKSVRIQWKKENLQTDPENLAKLTQKSIRNRLKRHTNPKIFRCAAEKEGKSLVSYHFCEL